MNEAPDDVFQQIPWFATTQSGDVDLYASVGYRSHNYKDQVKPETDSSRKSSLGKGKDSRKPSLEAAKDRRKSSVSRKYSLTESSASKPAWEKEEVEKEKEGGYFPEKKKIVDIAVIEQRRESQLSQPHRTDLVDKFDKMSAVDPMGNGPKILDANRYATKKTIAQGMLDVALLTANASQLKYVLQVGEVHEFYSLMLGLIITSIVLQGLVGITQLILGPMNINKNPGAHKFLSIVNYLGMIFSFGVMSIDTIKMCFGLDAPPWNETPNK